MAKWNYHHHMKKIDEPEEETQLRQRKPVDHGQVRLNILPWEELMEIPDGLFYKLARQQEIDQQADEQRLVVCTPHTSQGCACELKDIARSEERN